MNPLTHPAVIAAAIEFLKPHGGAIGKTLKDLYDDLIPSPAEAASKPDPDTQAGPDAYARVVAESRQLSEEVAELRRILSRIRELIG
ncbi:hypothetical protein JRC04_05235 [Mycolicibacterium sp. S2-37]|uniref:hypothetical protein n=1 Tax=Mycolicibacterium sp. S2-37 TaxID=2810297 RepID=UPI001A94C379|nr:hypothetical protein [Mycolicibacterium sp. S2-37]MBO0676858.1 hypothetical protein [Mycolicibacterium sp. S2-37]